MRSVCTSLLPVSDPLLVRRETRRGPKNSAFSEGKRARTFPEKAVRRFPPGPVVPAALPSLAKFG